MPVSQQIISWGIVLAFIFLVCDHSWWAGALKDRAEKGEFPGTPVYEQALKDLSETNEEIRKKLASGKISPEETARLQYAGIECLSKMGRDWSNFSSGIFQQAEVVYAKNWQPSDRDQWMKSHIKTETDRLSYAKVDFGQKFLDARNVLPRPECLAGIDVEARDFLRLGSWIIKWYYLLVIPIFLVVLVGKHYEGVSIKEEILLQPSRLVWAFLGGPIGLFNLSGVAARVYCYRRLRQQFLANKPWNYGLTRQEDEALWVQVYEPILSFDQAVEKMKGTGKRIRRPLVACILAWLFSLAYHQTGFRVTEQVAIVSVGSQDGQESILVQSAKPPTTKGVSLLTTIVMLAVLPSLLTWPNREKVSEVLVKSTMQPVQHCCWNPDKPRGPPSLLVRKQYTSTTLCLSGLATVTEG